MFVVVRLNVHSWGSVPSLANLSVIKVENKCADLEREIEMMKLELDSYDKRISDMRMKRMKAEADLANSSGQVSSWHSRTLWCAGV